MITDLQVKSSRLRQLQALPLGAKIRRTENLVRAALEEFDNNVFVSFSGGADSTVMLDIIWSLFPKVPAVFADTGLEYPEVRTFVKSFGDRVVWVKPKMRFDEVIKNHGYPVVSKSVCQKIHEAKTTKSPRLFNLRMNGIKPDGRKYPHGKIPEKWKFLLDAPFDVTSKCCKTIKNDPCDVYSKEHNAHAFVGTMAEESISRKLSFFKLGCNAFKAKDPKSRPMMFWTTQDVLAYLKLKGIPYASVYGDIEEQDDGSLQFTGLDRTGCMFCMFGVHLEEGENRFQRMKRTHPKQWDYCINTLGLGKVLKYTYPGLDYGGDA